MSENYLCKNLGVKKGRVFVQRGRNTRSLGHYTAEVGLYSVSPSFLSNEENLASFSGPIRFAFTIIEYLKS